MPQPYTITLTEDEYRAMARFVHFKKLTGTLLPEVDPMDAFVVRVLMEVERQRKKDAA